MNRRTAPSLYLGVEPVVRRPDGSLHLGGEGEAVDWVVLMRRFPAEALLDRVASEGRLTAAMLDRLADGIAAFHGEAEVCRGDAPAEFRRLADGNAARFRAYVPQVFDAGEVDRLVAATEAAVAAGAGLLSRRVEEGFLRHCHGDLHLRNIYLNGEIPEPFDALEFDDRLARTDVLYDLAFLLMDLWHRELRQEANRLMNRYLLRTVDYAGLALMPLFLSLRAGVRAHVSATMAEAADEPAALQEEARAYLRLAQDFLEPKRNMLVAVGGFSGSGKSSVAMALAPALGPAPGAVCLRSDEIRKTMFSVALDTALPQEAYTSEVSARVYGELRRRAALVLGGGYAAIADAVHNHEGSRQELDRLAEASSVPFHGFWLTAPAGVLAQRIAGRSGDASDADVAVMERQLAAGTGPMTWTVLDAVGSIDEIAARALRQIRDTDVQNDRSG